MSGLMASIPAAGRPRSSPLRGSRPRLMAAAAVALALASALAGCGGSAANAGGVAHIGATSSSNPSDGSAGTPKAGQSRAAVQERLVRFAQCMRTHGEPEFPEPSEGAIRIQGHDGSGPNPESPQWKAAEKRCAKYAPSKAAPSPAQQKAHQEEALKFAECMRAHGVPGFPDPKFVSGGGVQLSLKAINPRSPQFQAAQRACQSNGPFGKHVLPPVAKAGAPGGAQSSEGTAVAP